MENTFTEYDKTFEELSLTVTVYANGNKVYRNNKGEIYRRFGPAIIYHDGYLVWAINGQYHREDGPARLWPNGDQEWWLNGRRHRVGGPAVIRLGWDDEWWINGEQINGC